MAARPEGMIRQTRLVVPADDADIASDRLWCAGAAGVEEVDRHDGLVELRTVLGGAPATVRGRLGDFPASWSLEFVDVDRRPTERWRDNVSPFEVAPGLTIVPAWWVGEIPTEGAVLNIEPGGSFGLGDHPTTRLCLQALAERDLSGARVLDVGCGSGVLGILAARRGADAVTAIDIADAAVEATRQNASANSVVVEASTTPLSDVVGSFDLVLANLLAPLLVANAADLIRLIAPGGRLIMSGVLDGHYDHVIAALAPLVVVGVDQSDGWAAIELAEPASNTAD